MLGRSPNLKAGKLRRYTPLKVAGRVGQAIAELRAQRLAETVPKIGAVTRAMQGYDVKRRVSQPTVLNARNRPQAAFITV